VVYIVVGRMALVRSYMTLVFPYQYNSTTAHILSCIIKYLVIDVQSVNEPYMY
jgi:hypothetical protein